MDEMPRRTIRIPEEIWRAAHKKARERGLTVSQVVRRGLERWVKPDDDAA